MHRSTKQRELYLDAASLKSSTQNVTILEISSKGALHMLLSPKKHRLKIKQNNHAND
jgi:hypothetical protein